MQASHILLANPAHGSLVSFFVSDPFNPLFIYSWDYGDGYFSSEYEEDHLYADNDHVNQQVSLTVSNELGCSDTASLTLNLPEFLIYYIPNAFTPNQDNFNNSFQPIFYSGFDPYNYHLSIYNRWGEVVFESYDALYGWDGTYGGNLVDDGIYIWNVEFKDINSDKIYQEKGHVTVLK